MTTRDQAIQFVCETLARTQGFDGALFDFKHAKSRRSKAIYNNASLIIEGLENEYGVVLDHDN